jgi:hypothetical protein
VLQLRLHVDPSVVQPHHHQPEEFPVPVTVSGASDDLIDIEGDVVEGFPCTNAAIDGRYLAFSNGTVLRIELSESGVWRIQPVKFGTDRVTVTQAPEGDEDRQSDVAEIEGRIEWVVFGRHCSPVPQRAGS